MKIPKSVTIEYSLECNNCDAVITHSAALNKGASAAASILSLAEKNNWMPLMLGRSCIGAMCGDCSSETLETDEEADENGSEETQEEAEVDTVTRIKAV